MAIDPAFLERKRRLGGGALSLEIDDLMKLLPCGRPMLLLDRVISLIPGKHAVGIKMVTGNEFGLATRVHGFVFPATLAVEALGQLGAVVLLTEEGGPARRGMEPAAGDRAAGRRDPSPRVASVLRMEVHRELLEASALHLTVSRIGDSPSGARFEGQTSHGGELYVEATFEMARE